MIRRPSSGDGVDRGSALGWLLLCLFIGMSGTVRADFTVHRNIEYRHTTDDREHDIHIESHYQGEQVIACNSRGVFSRLHIRDLKSSKDQTTIVIIRFDKNDAFIIRPELRRYNWFSINDIKGRCRKDLREYMSEDGGKEHAYPSLWPIDTAAAYWRQHETTAISNTPPEKCRVQSSSVRYKVANKSGDSLILEYETCSTDTLELAAAIQSYRNLIETRVTGVAATLGDAGISLDELGFDELLLTPLVALSHDSLNPNLIAVSQDASMECRCHLKRKKGDTEDKWETCDRIAQSVTLTDYQLSQVPDTLLDGSRLIKHLGRRSATKYNMWELLMLLLL